MLPGVWIRAGGIQRRVLAQRPGLLRRALHCYHDRKNDNYVAPSDSTFFRVLNLIAPEHFEKIVTGWLLEQEVGQLERLAVDGKVLRGTGRGDGKPLALLSVVTHQLRTTLRSVQIAEKSNEIPAIKPLLAGMNLEGSLLTKRPRGQSVHACRMAKAGVSFGQKNRPA